MKTKLFSFDHRVTPNAVDWMEYVELASRFNVIDNSLYDLEQASFFFISFSFKLV